jgi:hypothetical protein
MLFTSNKTYNVSVYNSITNTLVDEKFDSTQPFSFLEFLNYSKSLDNSVVEFTDYQEYLKKWNTVTIVKYNDLDAIIKTEFVTLLKSIALNYTTSEEKRYLSNIDFNNPSDLEVAAPFFATKIKQVLLYFAEKRDTYAINFELSKNKGSVFGVTNYIKTNIIETIFGNDLQPPIVTTQPLSTLASNLQIELEEGYDTYNNYFDLDPFEPPAFYTATGDRAKYFSSNTNIINKEIFLDYDRAIINLINSERVVLQQLQTLVVNINTPNLNLLQDYDFIDYDTRTRENLKLILNAELVSKFTGTSFYYLSTNSTGESLSGLLFDAESPFSNLLNVHNPTTLTVPESSIKFERDVGLFFKPTLQSILQLQTPFTYSKNNSVKNNYVYIFPDPDEYGNISGVSKTDHESPLVFTQQGFKIQKNISSNNAFGNSLVTKNDFTFESYHSKEQNSVKSIANELYNNGVVTDYVSDLYGNIYLGFKQQNTGYLKNYTNNVTNNLQTYGLSSITNSVYLSSIQLYKNYGTFANTSTTTLTLTNNVPTQSIYKQRNSPGNFYVYNIFNDTITSLSSSFINVFNKYTGFTYQLNNNLTSINTYNNTFVFTTTGSVIVDQVNYVDGVFTKSSLVPFTLTSVLNDKTSNEFLVNDSLYFARMFVSQSPLTSGYNSRYYTLEFCSYDMSQKSYKYYNFDNNSNFLYYNIGTLLNVQDLKLIFNKKKGFFNLVITLKDLNNNIFIDNKFLNLNNNNINIVKETFFSTGNINSTINFYDSSFVSDLQLAGLESNPTPYQDSTNGTLVF